MHLLHALQQLISLGQHPQAQAPQQAQPQALPPQDPGSQGFLPDTTYNPNPNTNIPWSSHNLDYVRKLAQIEHNPGGIQQPSNMPIGGFQNPVSPQRFSNQPLGINPNNFRDTQIKF